MFGIASAAQYANAKCGNIFLFFIFDVKKNENAETVFMLFFLLFGTRFRHFKIIFIAVLNN